jgi:DNA polymerase-1
LQGGLIIEYRTLIIDGPYIAHKSYSAPYRLTTQDGLDATMIHGFIRSLNATYKRFKPNKVLIAWESHGTPSWRKEQSPLYKPGKLLNKQFVTNQEDLKTLLYLLNIPQYYSPSNEADDVIARLTISISTLDIEYPILIYTSDKDIMQLIGEQCHTYNGKEIMTATDVYKKFGVFPEDIPKFLAIVGDTSDNIIGIKGIGPKKAAEYLCGLPKENHPINKYKDQIAFNEKLTKLNFGCELVELKPKTEHTIESLLDKYKLKSIKEKIEEYKQMGKQKC